MPMPPPPNYDSEFEELGEPEVRRRLSLKQGLHVTRWPAAEAWLLRKAAERTERSEERETEAISISRTALRNSDDANSIAAKALDSSRFSNRLAISAIVLSIAMAIQEIIQWLTPRSTRTFGSLRDPRPVNANVQAV